MITSFIMLFIGLFLGYFIGRFSEELSIFFSQIRKRGIKVWWI